MRGPPVTLVLMTTNQGPYLAAAIEAALAQDYPDLSVLITDNASDDATPEIVAAALARHRGTPSLRAHRFERFLGGPAAHMTAALALVESPLVVFQHGDDLSEPGRVSRLVPLFDEPRVLLAYSAVTMIDAAGREIGALDYPAPPPAAQAAFFARVQGHVLGATLALRPAFLRDFPPLDDRAFEDTTLPFRAALAGRLAYAPERLLRYRRHGRNVTHALHDLSTRATAAAAAEASLARLRIIAELRRADLAHWLRTQPAAALDATGLERVIADSLAEAEDMARLHRPGAAGRLAAAGRIARRSGSARGAVLALVQALWPALYVAYRRHRARRR